MKRVHLFGDPLAVREPLGYRERGVYMARVMAKPTRENYDLALRTFVWTARRALIVALNIQDVDSAAELWRIDNVDGLLAFSRGRNDAMLEDIIQPTDPSCALIFAINGKPSGGRLEDPAWLETSIARILADMGGLQRRVWGRTRHGTRYNGKDIYRKVVGFKYLESVPHSVADNLCNIDDL